MWKFSFFTNRRNVCFVSLTAVLKDFKDLNDLRESSAANALKARENEKKSWVQALPVCHENVTKFGIVLFCRF